MEKPLKHIQYRAIPPADFAALGMEQVAFVKRIEVAGANGYAVHAADGTQMAVLASRDIAFAAVRQHDMEPLSVH
jgi:hypothetical protein